MDTMPSLPPTHGPDWLLNLLAGVIGGAVRAITQPDQSWWQRMTTSFVGGVTSLYLTPILAPVVQTYLAGYEVSYGSVSGLCGFLLGMSGLAAAELAIRVIKRRLSGPGVK